MTAFPSPSGVNIRELRTAYLRETEKMVPTEEQRDRALVVGGDPVLFMELDHLTKTTTIFKTFDAHCNAARELGRIDREREASARNAARKVRPRWKN